MSLLSKRRGYDRCVALWVQVGQLLLYARVSSNNRMLPFCSQIIDLVQDMSAISPSAAATTGEGSAPVAKAEPPQPADQQQCQQQCGARFAGILVGSSPHLHMPVRMPAKLGKQDAVPPLWCRRLPCFPTWRSSMCSVGHLVSKNG